MTLAMKPVEKSVQVFEASDDLSVLIRHAHLNSGLDESQFKLVSGGMPPAKFTDADRNKSLADLGFVLALILRKKTHFRRKKCYYR